MNADGSDVRQLTNVSGYDGGPFISPDGQWVIFRSDRKEAAYLANVRHWHRRPAATRALTDTIGVNWGPYWHPHNALHHLVGSRSLRSQRCDRITICGWLRYEVVDGKFQIGEHERVTDSPEPTSSPCSRPMENN